MVRGGDGYGVDVFIFEELAVVLVGFDFDGSLVGVGLALIDDGHVGVADGHGLTAVGVAEGVVVVTTALAAGTDDGDIDAVIGTDGAGPCAHGGGESGGTGE